MAVTERVLAIENGIPNSHCGMDTLHRSARDIGGDAVCARRLGTISRVDECILPMARTQSSLITGVERRVRVLVDVVGVGRTSRLCRRRG
jgi:hypothetical protein